MPPCPSGPAHLYPGIRLRGIAEACLARTGDPRRRLVRHAGRASKIWPDPTYSAQDKLRAMAATGRGRGHQVADVDWNGRRHGSARLPESPNGFARPFAQYSARRHPAIPVAPTALAWTTPRTLSRQATPMHAVGSTRPCSTVQWNASGLTSPAVRSTIATTPAVNEPGRCRKLRYRRSQPPTAWAVRASAASDGCRTTAGRQPGRVHWDCSTIEPALVKQALDGRRCRSCAGAYSGDT